jgi:uncharacterized protein
MAEPFHKHAVHGFLHRPTEAARAAIALTHGAGSNANAPLLTAVCEEFVRQGLLALRFDLPFRQDRASGPPRPGDAARDRDGIRAAAEAIRGLSPGPVFIGGHSYGGRQATMLAASEPQVAGALLLLSYPLHPPRRPAELRTAHFPDLRTASFFVHGGRDPFGSLEEMRSALSLIPGPCRHIEIAGAGHDLKKAGAATEIVKHFIQFTFSAYNE